MITLREPVPILPGMPNAEYLYNDQLQELFQVLNNISLTSRDGVIQHNDKAGNLDAKYIVFTSNGTANTEDAVTHDLGRIARYYFPVSQDKAATLYDGGTAPTSTTIYLKSSATSVAWVSLIF